MGLLDFFKREVPADPPSLSDLVEDFWASIRGVGFSPNLIERVWAASRCLQLNSQQISSMPLRFFGPPSADEPAWLANPDPAWFPNGIGDAIFAAVRSMYAPPRGRCSTRHASTSARTGAAELTGSGSSP
jgi:hypothetical protein